MGLGYHGHRAFRLSSAVLAVVAVGALTAACGSDGSPDAHRAVDAVLTQADLPAGLTAVKLGHDEIQQVTDQFHDSVKDVEVTPADCVAPGSMASKIDVKTSGLMAATDEKYSISESVQRMADVTGDDAGDLTRLHAQVTGECAEVRVKVTAGPIKGSQIDTRHTVLDVPAGRADQLLVVQSDSTTSNEAKDGSSRLLVGRAVVNGLLVTVQMVARDDSGELDPELFKQVLKAAIDKAAA